MIFEKTYTTNEVAKVTGYTARTIRNYIKDGKLIGKKVGKQWRFTEEDIQRLFLSKQSAKTISEAQQAKLIEFFETEPAKEPLVCSIIFYPSKKALKIGSLYKKIREEIERTQSSAHTQTEFAYNYDSLKKRAEFMLSGSKNQVDAISKILYRQISLSRNKQQNLLSS